MARLQGKVALITGATSGIGAATARAFAREGARLVLTGRRAEPGHAIVEEIEREGGTATFLKADVREEADAEAAVAAAIEHFGSLDIAFNNAGVIEQPPAPLQSREASDYDYVFDTNVRGVFYCMKYQLARMAETRSGTIINNASVGGLGGVPGISLYIASKHAVIGLTKAAAMEAAPLGIRINAVAPYATVTGIVNDHAKQIMTGTVPLGRLCEADEQAAAVMFLASDDASFVTGAVLPVDGGLQSFLFGTGVTSG